MAIHLQTDITDHFSVHAEWEGTDPDQLDGNTPDFPCAIDVQDRHTKDIVAQLKGSVASRILCLLAMVRNGKLHTGDFNCYNTVKFVLGKTNDFGWIRFMKIQGEKLYVHEAVDRLQLPFVFQVCADEVYPQGLSPQWENNHGVAHAGLVIGKDRKNEPIVLEKDCHRRLLISRWADVADRYFHTHYDDLIAKYVTCFPVEELADA